MKVVEYFNLEAKVKLGIGSWEEYVRLAREVARREKDC